MRKKAERRKGIGEIDAEKKEKLKSKRMLYQVQLEKELHKCRLKSKRILYQAQLEKKFH